MTFATLGRDPGIFQYVAWALSKGERAYIDFRDINGPLPHLIHWLFLALGGANEHRFRLLDIAVGSIVFLFAGRTITGSFIAPEERTAFSLALCSVSTWAVLMGQYLSFGWWQTAQRESFYTFFLLASLGFQTLAVESAQTDRTTRRPWSALCFVVSGALSAATWFGKPPCLIFSTLQTIAIYITLKGDGMRRRGALWFAFGCVWISIGGLGFLHAFGDVRAAFEILILENPRLYRFIWTRSLPDAVLVWGNAPRLATAVTTLALLGYLFGAKKLSRRYLTLLVLPVGGLLLFFLQAKGFPYHLHPVYAGVHLAWVSLLVNGRWLKSFGELRVQAIQTLLVGGLCIHTSIQALRNEYVARPAASVQQSSPSYFALFPWGDFFAADLREAATYVQENTLETDRVQTYGMDPYFLFLAKRLSATPYIYSFELNVDAAIAGGTGGQPTTSEATWITNLAQRNELLFLQALERHPPAAFIFFDRAPFTQPQNSYADFAAHCPSAFAWMATRFTHGKDFGTVRVWLRKDRPAN
jgi:hypothetical protein